MENKYRSLDDLPVTLRVEELMPILGIGRNTASMSWCAAAGSAASASADRLGYRKRKSFAF